MIVFASPRESIDHLNFVRKFAVEPSTCKLRGVHGKRVISTHAGINRSAEVESTVYILMSKYNQIVCPGVGDPRAQKLSNATRDLAVFTGLCPLFRHACWLCMHGLITCIYLYMYINIYIDLFIYRL